MYNEIDGCSKELAVISYKLGLTLGERFWDDLTLDPPTKLPDIMVHIERYARLENDVKLVERLEAMTSRRESSTWHHKKVQRSAKGR